MKYEDIVELKKRMDFNLTESETLVELVKEAITKGEKVQKEMQRLKGLSADVSTFLSDNKLIRDGSWLEAVQLTHSCVVGIDGSFQLVGGAGGKWFAPISVARILFEKGLWSQPTVDVFSARIEEIDEKDDPKPNVVAEVLMLSGETKAILNWGAQNKSSYIFLDGPIVDPPVFSYGGKDYVKDRCQAIKTCLASSHMIGCVKRSRDKFFVEHMQKQFPQMTRGKILAEFPSDQHLFAYVFSHFRSSGYKGPIFTVPIDISTVNPVYKSYMDHGINIACLFLQKGVMSQVLRLDIPFERSSTQDEKRVANEIAHIAKSVDQWTYPGQDYPLPVYLAHQKCNIREGCAEVLYDEIMTKSYSTDPTNQTILSQLR